MVSHIPVRYYELHQGEEAAAAIKGRLLRRQMDDAGGRFRHIGGEIPAVRPGIGQQFLFIMQRHIKPEMLEFYNIPRSQIDNLRMGMDWTSPEGEIIPNSRLTTDPDPVRAYAYCSDTRYMPTLKDKLQGVTTLYHEATYCEDMKDKAVKYLHSTAREAAMTAREAKVKKLIIGHFSQRYIDETPLLKEAQAVFENTVLADENKEFEV